ncbi:hypothetical protein SAMN05216232_3288 [Virgibacillus subterraneus]|uniref:Zinc ribbon domain-containing protein n=1 Tax=Virgibacillus subterraneus TaxID=621109 RepID=A0A1H9IPM4_9BACI|nr:zinc ribbon domain-containing protein [Virgibacillus subterraneus]SEQ76335.1 hypothetical protein SAMN05216232_3288 [Virgibacillus subterraneus]
MQCPSCGQQTAEGKFCTNCGAQLVKDNQYESVAAVSTTPSTNQNPNETVEKLKTTGSNFGHFFVTLVKNPSEAKKANGSDMSSGIITFVLFSLLIALSYHLILSTIQMGFFMQITFWDSFILPFIIFNILYVLIAGLTFAGTKLSVQAVTFPDVIAKYGAYLVPFLLLYTAGILFWLIGLPSIAGMLLLLSILSTLLIAPTFILVEQTPNGFDRIYVLIGLHIIILLVFGFFIQSFMNSMLGNFMNMMFNNGF